jgi:hypothetical protein
MEPMKPDAANAGHRNYNIGDLVYWSHDMFLDNSDPMRAPAIILDVPNEKNDDYIVHILMNAVTFSSPRKNLFDSDET